MEKKNVVFLTVLAIATLLTAVIGTTFAYFTATVTNKTTPTTTTVTTAGAISVEYNDGAQIDMRTIVPGAVATKTFSVENKGTEAVSYSIGWEETGFLNTFVTNVDETDETIIYNDFVYSLTKAGTSTINSALVNTRVYPGTIENADTRAYSLTNGKAQIGANGTEYFVNAMPTSASTTLVGESSLAAGAKDTYVLTVYYLETGINQNENANGKTFTGTLKVNLVTRAGVEVETVTNP